MWRMQSKRPDTRKSVFFADIDVLTEAIERLPRSDLDDAQRYTRARRRRQFLAGRALVRLAIERRCALAFDAIRFERMDDAPRVAGRPEIALSLSHSGESVGCAVAHARACGFDLQHEIEKPLLEIAGGYFVPHEH